ncbi:MAG: formyltransferase [Burkholderiales bacterium]
MEPTAIVFAYHNVGVRCLSVLLAHGMNIPLVITHRDNPGENIWFDSVAKLAALHDIRVITPDDPNADEILNIINKLRPDYFFSFYYRLMLQQALLALPRMGAFNMHGSLLPQYRGRVPVNWAIINGETQTGATLHRMNEKPDNGEIVDQQAVPILPDDTAFDVFNKVTVAAEITLDRCLPALLDGSASLRKQDLRLGKYYGGRKAEDGRIDWRQSAQQIHNLVRAVAPPFPGALTSIQGKPVKILRSMLEQEKTPRSATASFYVENNRLYADCGAGVLRILAIELAGVDIPPETLPRHFNIGELRPDS